mmetsp:Transcript_13900/g.18170  ORF Transcript_13900/g.18170 Transcript_13900/m.18170 type:complete len:465 (+) Transcript_13900:274-1668(+)
MRSLAMKGIRSRSFTNVASRTSSHCVIVGGGIIGSSIAYFTKKNMPDCSVTVLERDCRYRSASAPLSVGGFRMQFSVPENIEIGLFSGNFIRNINEELKDVPGENVEESERIDLQFFEEGYLVLAGSEEAANRLESNVNVQNGLGAKTKLLARKELKERFDWLNSEDISMGSLGTESEGWLDPWSLLQAFRSKAQRLGVEYVDGSASGFETYGDKITGVNFTASRGCQTSGREVGQSYKIDTDIVVNACGAWSGYLNDLLSASNKELSFTLPVVPKRRSVFVFSVPDETAQYFTESNDGKFPLVVDPSGTYFRRDGKIGSKTFLCGKSPSAEADIDYDPTAEIESFEDDVKTLKESDYAVFEEELWPTIAHRVPKFENIKLGQGWSGFYDYNLLDQNAILGRHPRVSNLLVCSGFSGHGLQQSPAVGLAMSELIQYGSYRTLDLSAFGIERILSNSPVFEKNIY